MKEIIELLADGNTQIVQTHISIIFMKEDFVLKVKKPVNFGFLDFSTLEKRKHYCEEEVRLNRRLCPEAYLGVVPIERDGKVIEWAVKMKRLPVEKSLKNLIKTGRVRQEDIERVVSKIAEFHKQAETNENISSFGKAQNFRINTDENFQQTERFIGDTIDPEDFNFIREKTEKFYTKYGHILDKRAKAGFVKDCHGDLHTEHIVVDQDICIFDCIEFNERFRYIDIACDVAFLLMDMDYLGVKDLSKQAENLYRKAFNEPELELLIPFFKSYRAYVRGKVNSLMSKDPLFSEEERQKRAEEAKKYFKLAKSYLEQLE